MKKTLSWVLCLITLLFLAACGGQETTNSGDYSAASQVNANKADSDSSKEEATDSVSPINSQGSADEIDSEASEEEPADNANPITFEELIVVDNEECSIKITGIEPDNMWGYTLKANLENKSSEKKYMFSVTNAAINGVQCDPLFASEVAAGKKANENISFMTSTLTDNGISVFTDIELSFCVYDSDDWMADGVAEATVHVYPYGEDNAVTFERADLSGDTVVVDNDYVKVVVTGYYEDSIWGYTVNLFLLNKTDTEVMFSADDASVNGYMADPFYATSVAAGKCEFSSMSWADSTLEENGIDKIEEIEFLLKAYDANNWTSDDFVHETVTLNP